MIQNHIACESVEGGDKEPCSSSDGMAEYSKLFKCFSCGRVVRKGVEQQSATILEQAAKVERQTSSWRGLTPDTMQLYGTTYSEKDGARFQYCRDGKPHAIKHQPDGSRKRNWIGQWSTAEPLFGMSLFKSGGTKYVTITEGECLLPKTEVLTPNGWVALSEYAGEPVMVVDGPSGRYERPLAVIDKQYEGSMHRYQSGSYEAVVTADHAMIRVDHAGYRRIKSSDAHNHLPIPRTVIVDTPENPDWSDNDLQMMVMLSADFTAEGDSRQGGPRAGFKKGRKIERAQQLLRAGGYEFSMSEVDARGYTNFRIYAGQTAKFPKLFPTTLLSQLSYRQLSVIRDELVHWDGNIVRNRTQLEYSTKHRHNAEFVSTLCHLTGLCGTIISRANALGSWFKVSMLQKQTSSTQQGYRSFGYAGRVMCLQVSTGAFLIRYNGSISVTGNCDAMSLYQIFEGKGSVVSIKGGVDSAVANCQAAFDYLEGFENIRVAFDADEQGKAAAEKVAQLFGKKVTIMQMPMGFKDPNEALQAGKIAALIQAWWKAKEWSPDDIIDGADILDMFDGKAVEFPATWPWPEMNAMYGGIMTPGLYIFGAGTGTGKSNILRQITHHLLKNHAEFRVGGLFLEESIKTSALAICGVEMQRPIHKPGNEYDPKMAQDIWTALAPPGQLTLVKHFALGADQIMAKLKYLVSVKGVRFVILDHITMLMTAMAGDGGSGNMSQEIDRLTTMMRAFVEQYNIAIITASHLSRPAKGSHEEGARVSLTDFRGSHGLAQIADGAFGLERDQQGEERDSSVMTVRGLKNRILGPTGRIGDLKYDVETGLYQTFAAPEL